MLKGLLSAFANGKMLLERYEEDTKQIQSRRTNNVLLLILLL